MKDLAKYQIDYALLPIDGFYTMKPEDAAEAVRIIGAKHLIPMHMKPGRLWDYGQAMRVVSPVAMLMKPNDNIDLQEAAAK